MADSEQVLYKAELDNGEQLRVTISEFKGKNYLHIRKYWKNDAEEWQPGKGFSCFAGASNMKAVRGACEAINKAGTNG